MTHLSRRHFIQISAAVSATVALRRQLLADDLQGVQLPPGKALIVRQADPFNAEPSLDDLSAFRITPTKHFYVRSHGPVPKLKAEDFTLRVEGLVEKPLELSLGELQERFKPREQETTLTCAGNRRLEMSRIKPVGGVQWDVGAIGHAKWAGAILANLLEMAELQANAKHVWFEGLDPIQEKDGSVAPFGGSIPLSRALDRASPVLLAHEMNGEPLTAEHGFPLRAVVPGFIGARSVKWLGKITVSDRPSPNHYVAEAYKLIQSDDQAEVAAAEPIYEFPVNAAICTPTAEEKLKSGRVIAGGYALPGGGAKIEKVELSTDGGKSWRPAKLGDEPAAASNWRTWSLPIELPAGKHELIARATDSAGRVQPESCEWNLKGYLYNAWHQVSVEVV